MRLEFFFFSGEMKAWRAVEAVAIEQGHCWHAKVVAALDENLGGGRAFEEAEGGAGMEFDVHQIQLPIASNQFPVSILNGALKTENRNCSVVRSFQPPVSPQLVFYQSIEDHLILGGHGNVPFFAGPAFVF